MKSCSSLLRLSLLALVVVGLTAKGSPSSRAAESITVAPIFGDHMVLQRDQALPVWGTATAGQKITVKFAEQTKSATADNEGKWRLVLDAIPASTQPQTLTVAASGEADGELIFEDVLVGEVWLCSGQSNMAWTLGKCTDGENEVAAAKHPQLRLNGAGGAWQDCTPESAARFSAVAYFFGQKLHQELGVPVGLINRSVGGTPVEWWTPADKLARVPYAKSASGGDQAEAWMAHNRAVAAWRKKAKADGRKNAGPQPKAPGPAEEGVLTGIYAPKSVGSLYSRFLEPIAGYAMRGAIWYQGERNTKAGLEAAKAYRPLLANMITSWRENWGQGDFAFLVVQLPTFAGGSEGWAIVQEAQAGAVVDVPNAGHIDIRDQPDGGLHPKNKRPVGERLADLALESFVE